MMKRTLLVPVILAGVVIFSIAQAHNSQSGIQTGLVKSSQDIANKDSSGDAKNMATGDKSDAPPSWWRFEAEGPHMM